MKLLYITILALLIFGCKNIIKDQSITAKAATGLVELTPNVKTVSIQEVPINVKMDDAPLSESTPIHLSELTQRPVNINSLEPVSRPQTQIQPVVSNIAVSSHSTITMIIILVLCGFGILYFVINNGKK